MIAKNRILENKIFGAEAFVFDFFKTLVEVDIDTPEMWETLNNMGFQCFHELQKVWESDAFDGSTTPSKSSNPDYRSWRYDNLRSFVLSSGVPNINVDVITKLLIDIDRTWTVKPILYANDLLMVLKKANKMIGLCSNWDYELEPYINQAGFCGFDAVTSSAVIGARKPNRILFEETCNYLNISPLKAVFIGDNWSTDIVGAIRVGMTPVWIKGGNKKKNPLPEIVLDFENIGEFYKWLSTRVG